MRSTFDAYFPELLKHEGGFVDHPDDPGGATNLGITIGTLREWRGKPVSTEDVKNLTRKEAAEIYREKYWNAIKADDLPTGLDALAFDIAVNHGVKRWRQWAPMALELEVLDAIQAVTERRRKFYRGLKTFKTFGKGWMRRANEVEAWALRHARRHAKPSVVEKPKPPQPKAEPVPAAKPSWFEVQVVRPAAIFFTSLGLGWEQLSNFDPSSLRTLGTLLVLGIALWAMTDQGQRWWKKRVG